MQEYGTLRRCTEKELLDRLLADVQALGGVWEGGARQGGQLYALLCLYARMLAESGERFNRTPELHRQMFLRLQQRPRQSAQAAQAVLTFAVVDGYDSAVTIPAGTLASAQVGDDVVQYRTKRAFDAVPGRLTDLVWCDRQVDAVRRIDADAFPARIWEENYPMQQKHLAEFLFAQVFSVAGSNQTVCLTTQLQLHDTAQSMAVLCDSARFCWSLWYADAEENRQIVPLAVCYEKAYDHLVLTYEAFPCLGQPVWLRLELLDPAWIDLLISAPRVFAAEQAMLPDAVVIHDCVVDAARFYPFGAPLQSSEECYFFCQNAFLREGAEITLEFDLKLELTEETTPPEPEPDLKWVMKQPPKKPPSNPATASAQEIRWDYWNGGAYRPTRFQQPAETEWGNEQHVRLVFDRPSDMIAGEAGGEKGCYLRLSCGISRALYQIPRRVYTPRLENLTVSYRYTDAPLPQAVYGENFGERTALWPDEQGFYHPFAAPPFEQALCFGFDKLPANARLQLWIDVDAQRGGDRAYLAFQMNGERLATDDRTLALSQSGIVSVLLPETPTSSEMFGKEKFWLCLPCVGRQSPRRILGVYLNAQLAENRVRNTYYRSFDQLPQDGRFQLPHGNIVKIWLYVRDDDGIGWKCWEEYSPAEGELREGMFQADYQSGWITLPKQLLARFVRDTGEDFIGITYDTCDGARGNCGICEIHRLTKDIPFVAAVENPLPAHGGMDSEPDAVFFDRLEHLLYHGGRAVTPRDYEIIACDLFPQLHDVRCLAGRPVKLAVLLKESAQDFPVLKTQMLRQFAELGGIAAANTSLSIEQANPIAVSCKLVLLQTRHIFSDTLRQFSQMLIDFLHPVTGGVDKNGWPIGFPPSYAQVEAYMLARTIPHRMVELQLFAEQADARVDWRCYRPAAFDIPGRVQVKVEVRR